MALDSMFASMFVCSELTRINAVGETVKLISMLVILISKEGRGRIQKS